MWILIVITFSSVNIHGAAMGGKGQGTYVAMQEFSTLTACTNASEKLKAVVKVSTLCVSSKD